MNKAIGGLFLLASLVFVSPVLAGGGPVEFTIDPSQGQALNPGEQYIVYARVYADGPYPTYCKNCFIKLALQNPQEGDYLAQNDGVTNDEGRIYAEVISKVPGNRTIYVSELRNTDGARRTANSSVVLNYTGESILPPNPTPTPTPPSTPAPSAEINVWLLSQQLDRSTNRNIVIKWSAFDGNPGTFTIYGRATSNKNNWDKLLDGQRGPSATINIRADEDYYIKVNGCQDKAGTCVDSDILLITKLQGKDGKIVSPQNPNLIISPTPNGDNKRVDELNKRVENLQNQLEESKQRQSFLEIRLNQLVSWIKSIFPFFE